MAFKRDKETSPAPTSSGGFKRDKEDAGTILDWGPLLTIKRTHPEDPFGTLYPGDAAQQLKDTARISASGITGGWADTINAGIDTGIGNVGSTVGLTDDPNFADELAKQEAITNAAKDRVNKSDPGRADALETATSMIGPGGAVRSIPKAWGWGKRLAALSGIGAGWGAVSESGHGRDPVTGALVGGVSGAAVPVLGAAGGKLLPWATGGAAGTATSWLGHALGVPEVGYAGTTLVAPAVKKGTEALMSKIPADALRNALAELSVAPTAAWGSRDTLRR